MKEKTEKNYYKTESKSRIVFSQMAIVGKTASYALLTMNTYLATESYGISLITLGALMVFLKIFDAFLTPIIGMIADKFCTRYGKIRILLLLGGSLQFFGIYMLFCRGAEKNVILYYIVMYLFYGIGWAIYGCGCDIIAIVSTTDPALRSFTNAVGSAFRMLVPATASLYVVFVILKKYNNIYTRQMIAESGMFYGTLLIIFTILACVGVSGMDKPETFKGIQKNESVSYKEIIRLLKENLPLRMYLISEVSDKVAFDISMTQTATGMLLFGIIFGQYQLSSLLKIASIFLGVIMIAFAVKRTARTGSRASVIFWSKISLLFVCIQIVFCLAGGWNYVLKKPAVTIFFILCYLFLYGTTYCINNASVCMCGDITDYELNRTGRYIPTTIVSLCTLIEQIVTAADTLIISILLALIGYVHTSPQMTDPCTPGVKAVALILNFGIFIITLGMNLIAMKYNFLTKEKMEEIQKENYEMLHKNEEA